MFTLPRTLNTGIQLSGRQSKVVLTDYPFGSSSAANKLLYSTASVLFAGTIGNVDTVFLYGDVDQTHEFALVSGAAENSSVQTVAMTPDDFEGGLKVIDAPVDAQSGGRLVLWADTATAGTFFAPPLLSTSPSGKLSKFFQFGTNDTVLVGGPYLVRNATLSADGATLALCGDLNATTALILVVPSTVRSVSWNGIAVSDLRTLTSLDVSGGLVPAQGAGVQLLGAQLPFALDKSSIALPDLSGAVWKFADSLPEVQADFDDSAWTTANHTTTYIPGPRGEDPRVLYGASCLFVSME
jgi:hypothetical protein